MIPFHMAFAIDDKDAARRFYGDIIGCKVGREAENWIDFDFFGHQISAHLNTDAKSGATSRVGSDLVPLHHFGAVLPWSDWTALIDRLRARDWVFILEPHVRFEGEPGEQGTFFVKDPAGNALEFKAYRHPQGMFDH